MPSISYSSCDCCCFEVDSTRDSGRLSLLSVGEHRIAVVTGMEKKLSGDVAVAAIPSLKTNAEEEGVLRSCLLFVGVNYLDVCSTVADNSYPPQRMTSSSGFIEGGERRGDLKGRAFSLFACVLGR